MKTMGWSTAILAAGLLGALAPRAQAASITWSGSVNSSWDINTTANWTGDATVFNDGDTVVFNDSGASPVTISGTVNPALKTFSNTAVRTYTLNGGTLAGTGNLVVDGGGLVAFGTRDTATPTPPALSFTGNTSVSNGSKLALYYSGAAQTLGIGSGTLTLDNGKLGFANMSDQADSNVDTLSSPITVNAGGGTLHTAGRAGIDTYQCVETRVFSGLLTLKGNLELDNVNRVDGTAAHFKSWSSKVNFTGGAAANGAVQINNLNRGTTYWDGTRGSTLTFTGPFTGSGTLTLTGADAATRAGTTYYLSGANLSGFGGTIKVETAQLQLAGSVLVAPLQGNGANTLTSLNATIDTANGSDNTLHIGTGATQFSTLYFNGDQSNSLKNGAGTGNVQTENGGTLRYSVGSGNWWQNVPGGNFRFMNGSTMRGDYRNNGQSISQVGTANHYLGDGDNGTADTVTFTTGSFFILHDMASRTWSQDDGVTIRYTTSASGAGLGWANYRTGSNNQLANLPVKNGAAGTQFAPPVGGTMYLAGRTSGNVMEISSPAVLTTAGTVQFRNNPSTGSYVDGPIAVNATGSLAFQTNGKVHASNATFKTGSALTVRLTGASSTACSLVDASGTLTFESDTSITITEEPGLPATYKGPWYVAKGTTLVGLPKKTAGLYTVTAEANQVRIDRLASGTVIAIR